MMAAFSEDWFLSNYLFRESLDLRVGLEIIIGRQNTGRGDNLPPLALGHCGLK